MNKLILLILSVFLLSGCQTSSLSINKSQELVLEYDIDKLKLSNKVISSKSLNYKDLFVKQLVLADEKGRVLFYEDAMTELDFEFNYNELRTVLFIFGDLDEYEIVYRRNNLYFLQLLLTDKTRVNLILQASSDQAISYVYGFSNQEFIKLAKEIHIDSDADVKSLKAQGQTLEASQESLAKWNSKMVYFAPLITPLRGMGNL